MIDAAWQGLLILASWDTAWIILLGIVVGFVVGVVPGVGGVVGMAVLLPFTFDMHPAQAFALLLTVATVISNASDFTAILFGVPGDGASGALVLDGRPIAKRGEPSRALSGNMLASAAGAIFGALVLVAVVPVIRPVVLSFGSPEFFALTVLGISFVGAVSSGQPLKGLVAGLLGLLLSTVGLSPGVGLPRYTFGYVPLWDGVNIAVAALALFAIPELADLIMSKRGKRDSGQAEDGGVRRGLLDVWVYRWLVLRCSAIGTVAGILPGLGAASAQWMAYGHALQTSKNPEQFGRGAIDGALGPGAANNSGLGGSLVPTVAFGVPGNVITALLLGAFVVHGVAPGPSMLTDNLPLTFSFAWTVVLANVVALGLFLPAVKSMSKIVTIRPGMLAPFLTLAVFVGAYLAGSQRLFSIMSMLAIGGLAIVMVRLDWPRAPMILGLVLGKLMEGYLLLSHNRYGFGFLTRPLVLVILALSLLVVFQPVVSRRRRRKREAVGVGGGAPGDATSGAGTGGSPAAGRRHHGLAVAVYGGLIAVAVAALVPARDWPTRMALMPELLAAAMLALSVAGLALELRSWRRERRTPDDPAAAGDRPGASGDQPEYAGWSVRPFLWYGLALLVVLLLGFQVGGTLLVFVYSKVISRDRWLVSLLATVGTGGAVWLLSGVVHLRDPALLWRWIGL